MTTEAHGGQDPRVQHHFDSMSRQFSASKLGMWLFLATELLMFGGLFCVYAVIRTADPEMFVWASDLLDTRLGAINTAVLITSSFTMATAVSLIQKGRRWTAVLALLLTLAGAGGFLGIKYLEYKPKFEHGLLWGARFDPDPEYLAHHGDGDGEAHEEEPQEEPTEVAIDLADGKEIAVGTCASCHGPALRGLPKNGVDLLASEFVGNSSLEEMVAFLKVGRAPFDPKNTTGIQMPPRGGNPTLGEDRLRNVAAFVKNANREFGEAVAAAGGDAEAVEAAVPAELAEAAAEPRIPHSVIPSAPSGPPGLARNAVATMQGDTSGHVPATARNFFAIYFLMTGLHGIHVIAGGLIITWLAVATALGRFDAAYYTPVDLGGLFWHVVDLIWIFLFPLFYLI
jgi:cytochrome c oxidase subunit 3